MTITRAPSLERLLTCRHCGRGFTARRAHAQYCSPACRQAACRASGVLVPDHAARAVVAEIVRESSLSLEDALVTVADPQSSDEDARRAFLAIVGYVASKWLTLWGGYLPARDLRELYKLVREARGDTWL